MTDPVVEQFREKITDVDCALIELVNKRLKLVAQLWRYKEEHGVDLVQLVSRPIPATPWRYRFDAVMGGHPLDPEIGGALRELRGLTRELRVFGSYPAAG